MSFAETNFYTGEVWRKIYVRLVAGHFGTYALVEVADTHEAMIIQLVAVHEKTVILDMAQLRANGEYYEFPVLL